MKARHSENSQTLARRTLLLGSSSLMLSGCFGSFAATRALWDFNDDFGNKWVKWLVFLGLSILPVYSLFVLADVLVLNSLEFWTGKNPLAMTPDGRRIARLATDDPRTVRVEVSRAGRLERVVYFRRLNAERLQLLDEQRVVVADVHEARDGSVQLRDAQGALLLALSDHERRVAEAQIGAGQSAPFALRERLGEQVQQLAQGHGNTTQL